MRSRNGEFSTEVRFPTGVPPPSIGKLPALQFINTNPTVVSLSLLAVRSVPKFLFFREMKIAHDELSAFVSRSGHEKNSSIDPLACLSPHTMTAWDKAWTVMCRMHDPMEEAAWLCLLQMH
jgi:hypothetical protein